MSNIIYFAAKTGVVNTRRLTTKLEQVFRMSDRNRFPANHITKTIEGEANEQNTRPPINT